MNEDNNGPVKPKRGRRSKKTIEEDALKNMNLNMNLNVIALEENQVLQIAPVSCINNFTEESIINTNNI